METLNIDGLNLAYVRRGRGSPLILIHGYPLDHSIWDACSGFLQDEFEVITPDLRGFGDSEIMEADHSIVDYASDVAGLMDHLRLRKSFVVGHSMGGYVALAFAREYPERVLGLGLIASQIVADSAERKEGRYATAREVAVGGVSVIVESTVSKLTADPALQARLRTLVSSQRALAISCALEAMADRPDSTEMFSGFRFPAVVVHGDADALIPVERGREMKSTLPSAHYVELKGVGHLPMMEDPQSVATALRFFRTVKVKGVKLLD